MSQNEMLAQWLKQSYKAQKTWDNYRTMLELQNKEGTVGGELLTGSQ